jgi:hypothetical protein
MANCGVNVPRDGSASAGMLRSLGATWIRIVAMPDLDLTSYFQELRAHGIRILLVLARESGGDIGAYARLYGSLVDCVQPGNEPDHVSPSSWTMTQAEFVSLGKAARQLFPTTPIVTAGLVSGHPSWLDGLDLSWADALAVHPYGKSPDPQWPHPGWGTGFMGDLLDGYAAYGKPLLVTELGLSTDQVTPEFQAEYLDRCAGYLNHRADVEAWLWFCLDDERMVPQFGLVRSEGDEKPSADAFRAAAAVQIHSLWPPTQEPPEPEQPMKPDPWQFWTAEQIAQAAGVSVALVREHWPRLVEQLGHCGINDRPTQMAMIGTVAVESGFRPVREAYYLGEPEPAESWRQANLRYYPWYGRGHIQLTWESNYRLYSQLINELWNAGGAIDLIARPDDALDPDISAAVAALYFRDHGGKGRELIPQAARRGDWREVRRLVQGADAGLDHLIQIVTALDAVQPPSQPPADPRDEQIAAYELALRTLRDTTIPRIEAEVAELRRIVIQFIGDAA